MKKNLSFKVQYQLLRRQETPAAIVVVELPHLLVQKDGFRSVDVGSGVGGGIGVQKRTVVLVRVEAAGKSVVFL